MLLLALLPLERGVEQMLVTEGLSHAPLCLA
jgi:hypothetical protein